MFALQVSYWRGNLARKVAPDDGEGKKRKRSVGESSGGDVAALEARVKELEKKHASALKEAEIQEVRPFPSCHAPPPPPTDICHC